MALILDGTNGLSDVDGSASTPAIRGTDINTGIFFPAADTIGFAEGGAEIARFDSNGNFGLGTTTPNIFGRGYSTMLTANSASGPAAVQINSATGNSAWLDMGVNGTRIGALAASSSIFEIGTSGAVPVAFFTNANYRLYITTAGNVGIGTNNPLTKLEVNGNASLTGAQPTFVGNIRITDNPTVVNATGGLEFFTSNFASGYGWKIASIDSSGVQLTFATRQNSATWSEQMRIDAGGNVGIGTSSPSNKLQVNGSLGVVDENLQFRRTGQTTWNMTNFSSNLYFNNGSDRMVLDSSGNLLVGTTAHLNFSGSTTEITVGTTGTGSNAGGAVTFGSGSGFLGYLAFQETEGTIGTINSVPLKFNTNNTERMRLDGSGNLCLNSTGYNDGKIVRVDNTDSRVRSMIVNNNNSGSSSRCGYIVNAFGNSWAMEMGSVAANSNALNWTVDIFGSPTVRMALTTGGAATNSTGSWGTISDARLKENIADATPKLDGLMQLRVVNYNLKSDPESKMLGFVAQEVEQVFAGLVDSDGDLTEEGDRYKSVKTTVLIPMLVKAIQEQQAIIQQLQADVAALKGA
jgi:hypothetical protein